MAFRINRKTAGAHYRQLFGMIAHKYREKPYRREVHFGSLGVKRIINFLPRGTYAGAVAFRERRRHGDRTSQRKSGVIRTLAQNAYYIGRAEFDLDTSTPIIYNKYK